LEKFELIGRTIGVVLIPVVLFVMGGILNLSLKKSDVAVRMVELAVEILETDPTEESSKLRTWAIDVIEHHHSEVPLPEGLREELMDSPLPVRRAREQLDAAYVRMLDANMQLRRVHGTLDEMREDLSEVPSSEDLRKILATLDEAVNAVPRDKLLDREYWSNFYGTNEQYRAVEESIGRFTAAKWLSANDRAFLSSVVAELSKARADSSIPDITSSDEAFRILGKRVTDWSIIMDDFEKFREAIERRDVTSDELQRVYERLRDHMKEQEDTETGAHLLEWVSEINEARRAVINAELHWHAVQTLYDGRRDATLGNNPKRRIRPDGSAVPAPSRPPTL